MATASSQLVNQKLNEIMCVYLSYEHARAKVASIDSELADVNSQLAQQQSNDPTAVSFVALFVRRLDLHRARQTWHSHLLELESLILTRYDEASQLDPHGLPAE